MNIFYNQQPNTLNELKTGFNPDNYFNNYTSTLIIKNSKNDPRYLLCLATPDKSEEYHIEQVLAINQHI